jgi:ring-1,2-phenylacetyl-CoA epoxidase subunit PaaD
MVMKLESQIEQIRRVLSQLHDPEIPVISLEDLGVLRGIETDESSIEVTITPTYSGCPAKEIMQQDIIDLLNKEFDKEVRIKEQLSPAWTTDWITEKGKNALFKYGIMPPSRDGIVICPQCESSNVVLISQFGSTACKALYKCNECLEPFDYFKCH